METLTFDFAGGTPRPTAAKPCLTGVLGSGNLEVLVEPAALGGGLRIEVTTSAVGFGRIWQAVLDDAAARWPIGDVRIAINDAGATPAVVALRLDQAMRAFLGGAA
jgi:malonate decarboxylase delta subunit